MNGRIYDPVIGRMITPDPTIPAPENLQAFNRYSYVYNNPLAFIDPGGLTPKEVGAASSGVTADGINATNESNDDKTSTGAVENVNLCRDDSVKVGGGGGGGGGGGDDDLTPVYDEYGTLKGFTSGSAEDGDLEFHDADKFTESDQAAIVENHKMKAAAAASEIIDADKKELTDKVGPKIDDGTSDKTEEEEFKVPEGYDLLTIELPVEVKKTGFEDIVQDLQESLDNPKKVILTGNPRIDEAVEYVLPLLKDMASLSLAGSVFEGVQDGVGVGSGGIKIWEKAFEVQQLQNDILMPHGGLDAGGQIDRGNWLDSYP